MLSLGSNIILVAVNSDDGSQKEALTALQNYQARGYCICPPVYQESTQDFMQTNIEMEFYPDAFWQTSLLLLTLSITILT